jgi:Fur family ferric uptake transcriptional regulator
LRVTRPRLAVYQALLELEGHSSVDQVVFALRQRGQPLPREAVAEAVEALHLAGLVVGTDAGSGRAVYEVSADPHHHFVCRNCARVIDVPCVAGESPCLSADFEGGQADEAQVTFRGVCDACASP